VGVPAHGQWVRFGDCGIPTHGAFESRQCFSSLLGGRMSNVAHITPHLRNVEAPAAIRDLPAWVVWRFEAVPGGGKPRKVPYYASGSRRHGEQGGPWLPSTRPKPRQPVADSTVSASHPCSSGASVRSISTTASPGGEFIPRSRRCSRTPTLSFRLRARASVSSSKASLAMASRSAAKTSAWRSSALVVL
jgi:hypothetical protein